MNVIVILDGLVRNVVGINHNHRTNVGQNLLKTMMYAVVTENVLVQTNAIVMTVGMEKGAERE